MNFSSDKKNKGFTIIESLVAITILVISVTGPLALASKGMAYSNYVRDGITAFYLANESMDVVRNLRDTYTRNASAMTNWMGGDKSSGTYTGGLSLCELTSVGSGGCYFDVWADPADLKKSFDNVDLSGTIITDFTLLKLSCGTHGDYYGKNFKALQSNPWYSSDCKPIEPSKFSRKVVITPITSNEIKVDSIVEWYSGGIDRRIVISENLFNIQ